MSTTNTTSDWYWYILKTGRYWTLGLVDEDGAAPDSVYEIEIIADKLPDDLTSDDDLLPIRPEHELGFAKGVAAEIMQMSKQASPSLINKYVHDYDEMKAKIHHANIQEAEGPQLLRPIDFRMDY